LDEKRIRTFLHHYLGETAGERLFWAMAGDKARAPWDDRQRGCKAWGAFWATESVPYPVDFQVFWQCLRQQMAPLLALGSNPYLLLMTAQVYANAGEELPANRPRLFAAFVDTLLARST
jgi:hypothetical protein